MLTVKLTGKRIAIGKIACNEPTANAASRNDDKLISLKEYAHGLLLTGDCF
jgi:hypothetical protein